MNGEFIVTRILDRIDNLDEKIDGKIGKLGENVNENGKEIALVKRDLENHLKNKQEETEGFKRRIYLITVCLGAIFTAYAAIKEFVH